MYLFEFVGLHFLSGKKYGLQLKHYFKIALNLLWLFYSERYSAGTCELKISPHSINWQSNTEKSYK